MVYRLGATVALSASNLNMNRKTAIVPLNRLPAQQHRAARSGVLALSYSSAARQSHGALSMRFKRERVLVIGCGDVAMRLIRQRTRSAEVVGASASAPSAHRIWRALTSRPEQVVPLRALGVTALVGNLDLPSTLKRLAGLATRVLHLAPPATTGMADGRTRALLRSLGCSGNALHSLVYVSTTGVYGDCQGAWVNESRPVAPVNARAFRRVDAEQQVRALALQGVAATVLRAPGIYAFDRPNGSPVLRLEKGTAVLEPADDVFTNHIHAEDLARACWLALWRGRAGRVFNANDDSALLMGDYFDRVAKAVHLPAPARISRAQAQQTLSAMQMSFLSESRRMSNQRIKRELRLAWRYPDIDVAVAEYLQRKGANAAP